MGEELTAGEERIIKALNLVDKLWRKEGKDLVLFNGNSLRKGGYDISKEITTFPNIIGEGGDGGDKF